MNLHPNMRHLQTIKLILLLALFGALIPSTSMAKKATEASVAETCRSCSSSKKLEKIEVNKFVMPLASPNVGNRSFKKEKHPILKKMVMHKGQDFQHRRGTPIQSIADGKVIDVVNGCKEGNHSCGGRFGNYIKLEHANGVVSVYAHLQSTKGLKRGAKVKVGQKIGAVGSTGGSTGPHLHFEVHVDGKPVNPMTFLKNQGVRS